MGVAAQVHCGAALGLGVWTGECRHQTGILRIIYNDDDNKSRLPQMRHIKKGRQTQLLRARRRLVQEMREWTTV